MTRCLVLIKLKKKFTLSFQNLANLHCMVPKTEPKDKNCAAAASLHKQL